MKERYRANTKCWSVGTAVCFLVLIAALPWCWAADQAPTPDDLNALLKNLSDPNPTIAATAAKNLQKHATESKQIVPALAQAMKNPNEIV